MGITSTGKSVKVRQVESLYSPYFHDEPGPPIDNKWTGSRVLTRAIKCYKWWSPEDLREYIEMDDARYFVYHGNVLPEGTETDEERKERRQYEKLKAKYEKPVEKAAVPDEKNITTIRELFEWAKASGVADKKILVEATTACGNDYGGGPIRYLRVDKRAGTVVLVNDDC